MHRFILTTILGALFLAMGLFAQEGTVRGIVTDSQTGEVLIGANVVLEGTGLGSATDVDGIYVVTNVPAGTYDIVVSYIGYGDVVLSGVTVAAGQTTTTDVALEATGIGLNAVTISASRRPEKTLEAPASVSILNEVEVRRDVSPSTISALRNTTGVDVSQTGVDRREVVLRGFNNAFSGAAYILTDYRQAAVPSLSVNIHSVMPNIGLDIDKIEVVRGPGSALYGPGVDAGVVHYITKDPISHPGTDISIGGGERSSYFGTFRHAGAVNEQFGYKITAQYAEANDWELDPNDSTDAIQLEGEVVERNYDYKKLNINGTLMYKFSNSTFLTASAGHSELDGTVLTGVGTAQADGFGYSYGQLRLQAGSFFAQGYVNFNDAGKSFLYRKLTTSEGEVDAVVDESKQFNFQAQYDFSLGSNLQVIAGADLDHTNPETKMTINGRNDDDDQVTEFGGYAQALFKPTPKLDITGALRLDYNNIFEETEFSPRLALVYKVNPLHSLRATYNRAVTLPGNNSLNLDLEVGAFGPITVRGRGSRDGFSWIRNSDFTALAGTDLVARSLSPATLGAAQPVGLPLDGVYQQVYDGLAATPVADLQALLAQNGLNLPAAQIEALVSLLNPNGASPTVVTGFSQGALAVPTSGGTFNSVTDLVDIEPIQNTITQTFELGYKGLVEDRFLVAIDGYYTRKENFVGPLRFETPLVFVPTLASDLQSGLVDGISNNLLLAGSLQLVGVTPEAAAELIVGFAEDQLPNAQTPVAIVAPDGNDLGVGQVPEIMLTYRNFGEVDFWGLDVSMQYIASDFLRLFGNLSFVSDDFFDFSDLGVENPELSVALNATKLKVKGGLSYDKPKGVSLGASGRYIKGFPVESGPYIGGRPERGNIQADTAINPFLVGVDNYFLLDINIGYDLYSVAPGLRLDVAVQNVLDNEHREFIGAPQLGRMAMARLGFSF